MRNFQVGDWVYASDWCYGQVIRIEDGIALVRYGDSNFCSFLVEDLRTSDHHKDKMKVFKNRTDAENVLRYMQEIVDRYGVVTRADYLELIGEKSEYTDIKYGWVDSRTIDEARVVYHDIGYVIEIPRAVPIV